MKQAHASYPLIINNFIFKEFIMQILTTNELKNVSGGWDWGTGSFIGAAIGQVLHPYGNIPGGAIGSIFDNIDYYAWGESYKQDVHDAIQRGEIPAD